MHHSESITMHNIMVNSSDIFCNVILGYTVLIPVRLPFLSVFFLPNNCKLTIVYYTFYIVNKPSNITIYY